MGNVNGREDGAIAGDGDSEVRSNGGDGVVRDNYAPPLLPPPPPLAASPPPPPRVVSSDLMAGSTPPLSPHRSRSPLLFSPQVPLAPSQRSNILSPMGPNHQGESHGNAQHPPEGGIPTIITWSYGGNDVAVEGSWDNWTSRKTLQRSGTGKDHSILLVLPSGVFHYKFIVDGEWRYIPDLPQVPDEMGRVCNLLDVHDYVPENLESVAEFEAPPSPDSSYGDVFPSEEEFAKDPVMVPSQLHLTVLGSENAEENGPPSKPQHVLLNHLYLERGRSPQSVVALGYTHRFQSKYVTVVYYKPLKR